MAAMLFPDDPVKRQNHEDWRWAMFFPAARKVGIGQPLSEDEALRLMENAANAPDSAEVHARWSQGIATGNQFIALLAIIQTDPDRASWNTVAKFITSWDGTGRSTSYATRAKFLPVAHLWAAWLLREQALADEPSAGYTMTDDVQVFLCEAMGLLQAAAGHTLPREKAEPSVDLRTVDFWTVDPLWVPPVPKPGWPRDGRVPRFELPEDLARLLTRRRLTKKK